MCLYPLFSRNKHIITRLSGFKEGADIWAPSVLISLRLQGIKNSQFSAAPKNNSINELWPFPKPAGSPAWFLLHRFLLHILIIIITGMFCNVCTRTVNINQICINQMNEVWENVLRILHNSGICTECTNTQLPSWIIQAALNETWTSWACYN